MIYLIIYYMCDNLHLGLDVKSTQLSIDYTTKLVTVHIFSV